MGCVSLTVVFRGVVPRGTDSIVGVIGVGEQAAVCLGAPHPGKPQNRYPIHPYVSSL